MRRVWPVIWEHIAWRPCCHWGHGYLNGLEPSLGPASALPLSDLSNHEFNYNAWNCDPNHYRCLNRNRSQRRKICFLFHGIQLGSDMLCWLTVIRSSIGSINTWGISKVHHWICPLECSGEVELRSTLLLRREWQPFKGLGTSGGEETVRGHCHSPLLIHLDFSSQSHFAAPMPSPPGWTVVSQTVRQSKSSPHSTCLLSSISS